MASNLTVSSHALQKLSANFFAAHEQQLGQLLQRGVDVIRLDVGSPDLPPPTTVIDRLTETARRPANHGYQSHRGPLPYRQAWADWLSRQYARAANPDHHILPLIGSKEGIFHLALAILNPGDVVLAPDPGYITYQRGAEFAGAEVYRLPLTPGNQFLPDLASIPTAILSRARLLWLNYPNNPTGASAQLAFFRQAVDFARQHNLIIAHDAAYIQVYFDQRPPSLLQVDPAFTNLIEFHTLSKSYHMAGWRIGAAIGDARLIASLHSIKSQADSSHARPVFEAGIEALTTPPAWINERNEVYRQRRDAAIHGLHNLGLQAHIPQAGMYVWIQLPAGTDEGKYASRLLEQAHVSITPGTAFGECGKGYLRLALTADTTRIGEAMQRWLDWSRE